MNKIRKSSTIDLEDKRDYCLSSLLIKDNNIREVIYVCDLFIKSVDDIYDSIIINKAVTSDINKYLSNLKQHLDNLVEDLHE